MRRQVIALLAGLLLATSVGCGRDAPPEKTPPESPPEETPRDTPALPEAPDERPRETPAPVVRPDFDPMAAVVVETVTPGSAELPPVPAPPPSVSPADLLAASRRRARATSAPAFEVDLWIDQVQKTLARAGFAGARVDGGALAVDLGGSRARVLEARVEPSAGSKLDVRFLTMEGGSDEEVAAYFGERFVPFEAGGYYIRPRAGLGARACTTNLHDPQGNAVLWQVGRVLVELRGASDATATRLDAAARAAGLYGGNGTTPGKTPAGNPVDDDSDLPYEEKFGKLDPLDAPFDSEPKPRGAPAPAFVGSWSMKKSSEETMVLHFEADGTYRGERMRGDKRKTQAGRWTRRGTVLIVEATTEDGKPSKERDELHWRVEGDRLYLRVDPDEELVFQRVAAAEPRTPPKVVGTWRASVPGAGRLVLDLRPDGTFQAELSQATKTLVETGTWEQKGAAVRMTSKVRDGQTLEPAETIELQVEGRQLRLRTGGGQVDLTLTR